MVGLVSVKIVVGGVLDVVSVFSIVCLSFVLLCSVWLIVLCVVGVSVICVIVIVIGVWVVLSSCVSIENWVVVLV